MRKLRLLLVFAVFLCADVFAQENLITVRGKTYDKKNIKVEYYKGKTEDIITNIDYDVVDELQAKIKKYEAEIAQLKEKVGNSPAEIKKLNRRIKGLEDSLNYYASKSGEMRKNLNNTRNSALLTIDSLSDANRQLRLDIKKRNNELEQYRMRESCRELTYTSLSIDFGIGVDFMNNKNMKETIWHEGLYSTKYLDLMVETVRVTRRLPLSLSFGIEFREMTIGGVMENFSEMVRSTDTDGDSCTIVRRYKNISEKTSLSYVGIPISVNFGQPSSAKVSGYGRISLTPAFNVSKRMTASGEYNENVCGDIDAILSEAPVLIQVINTPAYSDDYDPEINKFMLFGSVAGGIYVPVCNLKKNPTGTSLVFKAGFKIDYTLLPVSKLSNNDELFKYHLGSYNTLEKTCVFAPSFEVGLIYLFR